MRSSDFRVGKLLLILTMGICLPAVLLGSTQGTTTDSAQKPASTQGTSSSQRAPAHTTAKTAGNRSATHPATRHAATRHNTVVHRAASSTPAAKRAAAHGSAYSSQHARYSARNRRRRPLTGQQRLARLHLEPERVQAIQQALIREGYLQGDATGEWDARTHDAMLRYQTIHGFPATGLPEAKSLMKLGLGPHPLPPELDHATAGVVTPGAAPGKFSVTPPAPPAAQTVPPS